jgi:murein DD-endopeptidase MepM/ murein hydrolase activator NlpD
MHNQGGTARVQVGDEVQAGQVIALSGSTGYVSEPHLHYMITKPGTADTPSQVQTLEVDFVE